MSRSYQNSQVIGDWMSPWNLRLILNKTRIRLQMVDCLPQQSISGSATSEEGIWCHGRPRGHHRSAVVDQGKVHQTRRSVAGLVFPSRGRKGCLQILAHHREARRNLPSWGSSAWWRVRSVFKAILAASSVIVVVIRKRVPYLAHALSLTTMSLCPGYHQVNAFGPDDDYEEEEEEIFYVTFELVNVEPSLIPSYHLVVSTFSARGAVIYSILGPGYPDVISTSGWDGAQGSARDVVGYGTAVLWCVSTCRVLKLLYLGHRTSTRSILYGEHTAAYLQRSATRREGQSQGQGRRLPTCAGSHYWETRTSTTPAQDEKDGGRP